jgi:hypothetical protein
VSSHAEDTAGIVAFVCAGFGAGYPGSERVQSGVILSVELINQAESLLRSLKGVRHARVQADAAGRITRIDVVTSDGDERSAARNVQSAMFAALGVQVDVALLHFGAEEKSVMSIAPQPQPRPRPEANGNASAQVLEISSAARKADLNVAAQAAFDTLRAAQSSFHGFVFDGAELVTISGAQYIVVAVRRATTEARYCGAAPIIDSASTASARALMNAVGVAAMGGAPALEFGAEFAQPEVRKA